jgi:hypothetical protein
MDNAYNESRQPVQPETGRPDSGTGPAGQQTPPPAGAEYYRPVPGSAGGKSRVAAGFLSGFFPGLGQIYVGYYQLGFIYAAVVASLITVLASGPLHGLEPLFGISIGFFYIYNIIDAIRRAAFYNQVQQAGELRGTMPDIQMPSANGSLTGGIVLIVVGALILLSTKFHVSMEWLRDWWPVAVIAFGIYLVVQARRSKASLSADRQDLETSYRKQ